MSNKIVIIGNSAAGTAAIESIREHDQNISITQISDEVDPLYSRCLISYYLAGVIERRSLLYRDIDFHNKMNVKLYSGKKVTSVEPDHHLLRCNDGSAYNFDKLLIATGSSPKIPGNIPKHIKGVHVLRSIIDCEAIQKNAADKKFAVILGGGLIGMRAADALSRLGLKVKVIIGSNRVLSQMIDFPAAQIIQKRLKEHNIDILTGSDIVEVFEKDNHITSVRTSQNQVIECDILIAAKGVNPNTGIIEETSILKGKGIRTNCYMQTNYENIFAAGDVAETFDITTEEYTINALWTCAAQQGSVAGLNMVGRITQYDGSLGMNSLNFFDIPLISFGITSPKKESEFKILSYNQPDKNIYKKIVLKDNKIKGIILVGKMDNAGVLLSLLQKKCDVSKFENELLNDNFNYGKILKYNLKTEYPNYCYIHHNQN